MNRSLVQPSPSSRVARNASLLLLSVTLCSLALVGWPRFGSAPEPERSHRSSETTGAVANATSSEEEGTTGSSPTPRSGDWSHVTEDLFHLLREEPERSKELFEQASSQSTPEEQLALDAARERANELLGTWNEWEALATTSQARIQNWLRAFAEAEEAYRAAAFADDDQDGRGEYGPLREIAALTGEDWTLSDRDALVAGYMVHVDVPSCELGPDAREESWRAVAEPLDPRLAGPSFVVDQTGTVRELRSNLMERRESGADHDSK